jgi:hypothetical protein
MIGVTFCPSVRPSEYFISDAIGRTWIKFSNQLIPCNKVLEKLTVIQLVNMEPEGSLQCLQVPITGPYPDPDASSPHLPTIFSKSILILSSRLLLDLPSDLFPSGYTIKTIYAFLISLTRATCHAHLVSLDLIILIIFGLAYAYLREHRRECSVTLSTSRTTRKSEDGVHFRHVCLRIFVSAQTARNAGGIASRDTDNDRPYTEMIPCVLNSNGRVVCISWSSFHTNCRSDLTHWPFDSYECKAQFAPWGLQHRELELLPISSGVMVS